MKVLYFSEGEYPSVHDMDGLYDMLADSENVEPYESYAQALDCGGIFFGKHDLGRYAVVSIHKIRSVLQMHVHRERREREEQAHV